MTHKRVVVIANGECRDPDFLRRQVKDDDYIICVDGGSRHALAMGLRPDLILGDSDSLDPVLRRNLDCTAVDYKFFCPEKEKSDLELALEHAAALEPAGIVIIGALGGSRADHAFINLYLLLIPLKAGIPAAIVDERQEIRLVDKELTVEGSPGDYLSLFPLREEAGGVRTEGLKYPLKGETLHLASTRSLSNELLSSKARVSLESGLLLVFLHHRKLPQITIRD